MTLRPIRVSQTKTPETSLPPLMRNQGECEPGSRSLLPSQDAKDNKIFEQTKLTIPVMAVGGEKSFGPLQAVIMRHVATNVQEEVVLGSGHWLMEERPEYTVALIRKFIDGPSVAHTVAGSADGNSGEERLTPAEYKFPQRGNPGTGSSGIGGIETVVLKGNPDQAGVYTIMLRVPAHTRIAAHSHRDDRVATVISGTWHIGYGDSDYRFRSIFDRVRGCHTGSPQISQVKLNHRQEPKAEKGRSVSTLVPINALAVTLLPDDRPSGTCALPGGEGSEKRAHKTMPIPHARFRKRQQICCFVKL